MKVGVGIAMCILAGAVGGGTNDWSTSVSDRPECKGTDVGVTVLDAGGKTKVVVVVGSTNAVDIYLTGDTPDHPLWIPLRCEQVITSEGGGYKSRVTFWIQSGVEGMAVAVCYGRRVDAPAEWNASSLVRFAYARVDIVPITNSQGRPKDADRLLTNAVRIDVDGI